MLTNLKNKMVNGYTKTALGFGSLALVGSQAMAQSIDYSPLTSAVDFKDIVAVLLAVAVLVIGFVLVRNNIGIIKRFISSNAK
jgi:hypothetical protein